MNPLFLEESFPTELEQAVGLFSKRAQQDEMGAAKSMTVRVPWIVYASIKALSDHSGLSVNRVAVQLFRTGLEVVGENLPDEDAHQVESLRAAILAELVASGASDRVEE